MSDETTSVLVISHFFPPESMGGAHRWDRFSEHLLAEYDCRVVCPPPSYPFGDFDQTLRPYATETVNGTPVTRLWTYQPTSPDSTLGRIANYGVFAVLATLYVLCNFWRFDCVVTLSSPHTTFVPGYVANLLGRAWVVDIFDKWMDNAVELGYIEEASLGYQALARLEQATFINADHVIFLTETLAAHYVERYDLPEEWWTAIPFGVDETLFESVPATDTERRIIYTGNFGEAQAFEPFLEGFSRLDDPAELWLVGSGDRESDLVSLCTDLGIDDDVRFPGPVEREEIPELLATSQASLVPYNLKHDLDYARPNKLLETMAVGTPYIATAVTEIETVTNQSGGGLLVTNDPDEVADAMETLLGDEQLAQGMGERATRFIDENHWWPALGREVGDVIDAALEHRDRGGYTIG